MSQSKWVLIQRVGEITKEQFIYGINDEDIIVEIIRELW